MILDTLFVPLPSIMFIIEGAIVTVQYSILAVFFGFIIGTFLAISKVCKYSSLRFFANFYTSIFRGTPVLIQLSIIYFGMPSIIGVKLNVFAAGVITFSLNSGAYVSEIIRAGINTVDKGQFEVANALGIPKILMIKDIILPQALRSILPALVNEFLNLIKESAVISMIGGMDLMRRAQAVASETYNFFGPMLIAAIAYYIMVLFVTLCAKALEKRLIL